MILLCSLRDVCITYASMLLAVLVQHRWQASLYRCITISSHCEGVCTLHCNLPPALSAQWVNDHDLLSATVVTDRLNASIVTRDPEIKVRMKRWLGRRNILPLPCRGSNLQPFDREFNALQLDSVSLRYYRSLLRLKILTPILASGLEKHSHCIITAVIIVLLQTTGKSNINDRKIKSIELEAYNFVYFILGRKQKKHCSKEHSKESLGSGPCIQTNCEATY